MKRVILSLGLLFGGLTLSISTKAEGNETPKPLNQEAKIEAESGGWTVHSGVFYANPNGGGTYEIGCNPSQETCCATKGNLCYAPGHGLWEIVGIVNPVPPSTFNTDAAVLIDPNYQTQL
jgi:hypothetical protein